MWLHSDHQPCLMPCVSELFRLSDPGKQACGCCHGRGHDLHLVEPQATTINARFVGTLLNALASVAQPPPHFTEEEQTN